MNNCFFDYLRVPIDNPGRARSIAMRLNTLLFFLLVTFAVACEPSPQIPGGQKQNAPVVISASPDRLENAERQWKRMLDAYGATQTQPDFHPIIYTPRSLSGVNGLNIMKAAPEPGTEVTAQREAVKRFIDRWQDLLNADPDAVSLVDARQMDTSTQRLTYRQANYHYPVAGNYGEMTVVINKEGLLLQLDDRFLPVVEIPNQPQVNRDAAARRVIGRTFTYSDIAGRPQQVTVNDPAQVRVKELVIAPIEKQDSIEVHLAWEIIAGTSLSWTVYIDAMTGEEILVKQNFNT